MTIRGVLFDIGGPIDTEEAFEAAIDLDIRSGLAQHGFPVDEGQWADARAQAVSTFAPSFYRSVIWRLTNGDLPASLAIYEWMEERAAGREMFELRDGIAEVLAHLSGQGLRLGLAANQPREVLQRLAEQGIGHYFLNEGVSGVYGLAKPDVRLFVRACEDLGVAPNECIMVGDRIDNDVVPPKLLGMRTVRLLTGRHLHQRPRSWDETPDYEVLDAPGILQAITALL